MTGTDWKRVKELFLQALESEPGERERLLARAPDAAVRSEVQSLLRAHETAGDAFAEPAVIDQSGLLEAITGAWALGRKVGGYRLERALGRGVAGTVFAATGGSGEAVVVELPTPEVAAALPPDVTRGWLERLERTAHPGLARWLAVGETPEGVPYLVAERILGTPVTVWARDRNPDLEERCAVLARAAAAMAHAHEAGLVHGDLKPRNLVVTDQGSAVVLDLGLASLLGSLLPAATLTTPYASPEQLRGEPASAAGDVYSLGVVLYEVVAGRLPYERLPERPAEWRHAIPGRPRRPLAEAAPEAPGELARLVDAMLAAEPARRPATGEVAATLRELAAD